MDCWMGEYSSGRMLTLTPLWPAGHLPLKGGDKPPRLFSRISNVAEEAAALEQSISPLEGEMAGRPEGGERRPCEVG
jgi:hypothetical protein